MTISVLKDATLPCEDLVLRAGYMNAQGEIEPLLES